MSTLRPSWPDIASVTDEHVPTDAAAHYLGRQPDTLRKWGSGTGKNKAPLTPIRVNGRLLWPVDRIREILKGGA